MIAECPKLIEDIMLTKEYSPKVGAYQVRLCKDGKWEVVVIDGCLPVYKNGELVFSKVSQPTSIIFFKFKFISQSEV